MDQCNDSPCENGGTCVDGVEDYRCQCTDQWSEKTVQVNAITASDGNNCIQNNLFYCLKWSSEVSHLLTVFLLSIHD